MVSNRIGDGQGRVVGIERTKGGSTTRSRIQPAGESRSSAPVAHPTPIAVAYPPDLAFAALSDCPTKRRDPDRPSQPALTPAVTRTRAGSFVPAFPRTRKGTRAPVEHRTGGETRHPVDHDLTAPEAGHPSDRGGSRQSPRGEAGPPGGPPNTAGYPRPLPTDDTPDGNRQAKQRTLGRCVPPG